MKIIKLVYFGRLKLVRKLGEGRLRTKMGNGIITIAAILVPIITIIILYLLHKYMEAITS